MDYATETRLLLGESDNFFAQDNVIALRSLKPMLVFKDLGQLNVAKEVRGSSFSCYVVVLTSPNKLQPTMS